ncbi:transmembrane protease serine 9 isoform X1 [Ditylenchus destructor]|uniref:Transmembrane protease serine 9 isoform X1 n=1 Tax=Ditylenchus destructor TaxID=166010 RepID=A0AAD4QT75_9BILA|nr:transmembrane protease serine 9 isoform X1 [Ditylenchus destructor]
MENHTLGTNGGHQKRMEINTVGNGGLKHSRYVNISKLYVIRKLEEPLNYTKNIRRICLSGKYRTSDPRKNVIAGWGVMDPAYPVYIDYDSDAICLAQRDSAIIFPLTGDGGGPAFLKENGRWTEIGIISYGTCDHIMAGFQGIIVPVNRMKYI